MEYRYWVPLTLEVVAEGDKLTNADTDLIKKKVHKRIEEFLIYWEDTAGTRVSGRLKEV